MFDVECPPSESPQYNGRIVGGVGSADAAVIFPERHIQDPMQGILNALMPPLPPATAGPVGVGWK